jgi:hypothetical protein
MSTGFLRRRTTQGSSLRGLRRASVWAVLAGLAWGQPTQDSAEVGRVRENIRTYLDELPRITCTEDTRQAVRVAGAESTETREDSCDAHEYKLLSVLSAGVLRGRAQEPYRERAAALSDASLGTTTGFLAALVDSKADAGFRWVRMVKVSGHALSVYAFHAAMPAGYLLADSKGSVRVPFNGLLYADAANGALVHVQIECVEIPRESEYVGADVAIEFSVFNVAGRSLNLPSHSRVHFRMQNGSTTNEAEYSGYRLAEFSINTGIKFGDAVPENK